MILRIIILSIVVYIFFLIPEKFLNLNYFKITQITIIDNSKMLQSELTNLTKRIYNKKNTQLNYKKLEDFYKKDLRVKNFEIKDVALGKIEIKVEGREVACYTIVKNKVFLMDKDGEIFGYLNEKERKFLPFIIARNREERLALIEILNKISETDLIEYVSQIFKVKEDEYRVILIDGVKLKIDLDIDTEKYEIAGMLYLNVKENKKIDYIDLRFDDYIIKYLGDDENERK